MTYDEKNKVIAEIIGDTKVENYHECWNKLMRVANHLKTLSESVCTPFGKYYLSFNIDIMYDNIWEYVSFLNKNPELWK